MNTIKVQLKNWMDAADTVGGIRCNLRSAIIFRCRIGEMHSVTFNTMPDGNMEPWYRNNERAVNFKLAAHDVSKNNKTADAGALVEIAMRDWLAKVIERMCFDNTLTFKDKSEAGKLHLHQSMNQVIEGNMLSAEKLWDLLESNMALGQFLDTKFDII